MFLNLASYIISIVVSYDKLLAFVWLKVFVKLISVYYITDEYQDLIGSERGKQAIK